MNAYDQPRSIQTYLDFLKSPSGQIQQQVLAAAFLKHLAKNEQQEILDAACGPGWLTKQLANTYPKIQGCDHTQDFIKYAKTTYRGINFVVADLLQPLPYPAEFFDVIILNMAGPDLSDLQSAFTNIFAALKPTGQFLMTIPNPYYTYPIGVWKRSLLDILSGKPPKLRLRENNPPHVDMWTKSPLEGSPLGRIDREFLPSQTISSHYYSLSDYFSAARSAGFNLITIDELRSETDSPKFDLQYQLYRYPLILVLEFIRPPQP